MPKEGKMIKINEKAPEFTEEAFVDDQIKKIRNEWERY